MSMVLLGILILLALILWFVSHRQFVLDETRFHLFCVRDDLFDAARRGVLSFDDPAYQRMRYLINAHIRHAHDLCISNLLLGSLVDKFSPLPESEGLGELERVIREGDGERSKVLMNCWVRVHVILIRHMFFLNPVTRPILTCWFMIGSLLHMGKDVITNAVETNKPIQWLADRADEDAWITEPGVNRRLRLL